MVKTRSLYSHFISYFKTEGYIILWVDLQKHPLCTSLLLSLMAVNACTHKHSALGFVQEATLFLLLLTIPASLFLNICRMKQNLVQDLKTIWAHVFFKGNWIGTLQRFVNLLYDSKPLWLLLTPYESLWKAKHRARGGGVVRSFLCQHSVRLCRKALESLACWLFSLRVGNTEINV